MCGFEIVGFGVFFEYSYVIMWYWDERFLGIEVGWGF